MQVIKVKKVPTIKTLTPVHLVPSPPPGNQIPISAKRLVPLVPLEPLEPFEPTQPYNAPFRSQPSYPPQLPVSPISLNADFDDLSISSQSDISEVSAKPTFDKRFSKPTDKVSLFLLHNYRFQFKLSIVNN